MHKQQGKTSGSAGRGGSFSVTDILGTGSLGGGAPDPEVGCVDPELSTGEGLTLTFLDLVKSPPPSDFLFRDGCATEGNTTDAGSSFFTTTRCLTFLGAFCFLLFDTGVGGVGTASCASNARSCIS